LKTIKDARDGGRRSYKMRKKFEVGFYLRQILMAESEMALPFSIFQPNWRVLPCYPDFTFPFHDITY
jgi:hypothetical protein